MEVSFIGNSAPIRKIKELIKVVADTALSVIIYGETGVGKDVVAGELYRLSNRRNRRFVKINCASIPFELMESELFGYDKGAFTGATGFKPGKFEIASGGAIFLDEVGDIPLPMQAKLLQVLQNSEFSRLGGTNVRVDTWVIAATNHDLTQDMKEGTFREDLYYRLNIIKIDVPPLRERKEDIPFLVEYLIEKYHSELGITEDFSVDSGKMDLFLKYDWPGNVRELANTIQRLMVLGNWDETEARMSGELEDVSLQSNLVDNKPESDNVIVPLKLLKTKAEEYIEKKVIAHALDMAEGNKTRAAKILNISYKALFYKMNNLGLR